MKGIVYPEFGPEFYYDPLDREEQEAAVKADSDELIQLGIPFKVYDSDSGDLVLYIVGQGGEYEEMINSGDHRGLWLYFEYI